MNHEENKIFLHKVREIVEQKNLQKIRFNLEEYNIGEMGFKILIKSLPEELMDLDLSTSENHNDAILADLGSGTKNFLNLTSLSLNFQK